MTRPDLEELARHAQKSDYRVIGNWMARRVTRPLALRITWIVLPWGISAHAATLFALLVGLAAAAAFAQGSITGWLVGALLLQAWYLLDHVDGQLARWHRTASLDGVQLDYLMHHVVHLSVPVGIGAGLFVGSLEPAWLLVGFTWGLGLLVVGLKNDAAYKAFFERLQRIHGALAVMGGGGTHPLPAPPMPRVPLARARFFLRKSCEIHVIMNSLTMIAIVGWLMNDRYLLLARAYVAVSCGVALVVACGSLARSLRSEAVEREFAAWFRVPEGETLVFDGRRWRVEPSQATEPGQHRPDGANGAVARLDPQSGLPLSCPPAADHRQT